MILRPDYIEAVKPFMDAPLVKILTGVRRCGKSTIFEMIRQELLERGIPEDHIVMKKYTEMDIPDTITAKPMSAFIPSSKLLTAFSHPFIS